MGNPMTRRRPARDLRTAIDCLPLATRKAMLEGVEANRIIVGAYTDRKGGVCPMLAAHRNGGRTSLASFARAWDRYTNARGRARPATEHELTTLRAMLEASIALDELPTFEDAAREAKKRVLNRLRDLPQVRRVRARRGRAGRDQSSESPGRTNCSSGTTQLREVLSRKRIPSAMSSGWIISSFGT